MDFPQGGLDRRRDMLENIGGQDEIEGSRKLAVGLGKVKPRLPVVVRIPVIELLLQDGRVALLIRHAEGSIACCARCCGANRCPKASTANSPCWPRVPAMLKKRPPKPSGRTTSGR